MRPLAALVLAICIASPLAAAPASGVRSPSPPRTRTIIGTVVENNAGTGVLSLRRRDGSILNLRPEGRSRFLHDGQPVPLSQFKAGAEVRVSYQPADDGGGFIRTLSNYVKPVRPKRQSVGRAVVTRANGSVIEIRLEKQRPLQPGDVLHVSVERAPETPGIAGVTNVLGVFVRHLTDSGNVQLRVPAQGPLLEAEVAPTAALARGNIKAILGDFTPGEAVTVEIQPHPEKPGLYLVTRMVTIGRQNGFVAPPKTKKPQQ